jgi:hypothetical protein
MAIEMNPDDGAQVLLMDELTQVRGGQEEIAVVPIAIGYLAHKAIDYVLESFSSWSDAQTHAPYTGSYDHAIDAANQAALEQDMVSQMDLMSGCGG